MSFPISVFLSTHVANLALNPRIGLIFIFQEPQETHGLTSISHESLVADQLAVGAWMLLQLLENDPEGGTHKSAQFKPWINLPAYIPIRDEKSVPAKTKTYEDVLTCIREQMAALGNDLWDPENADARTFLFRLTEQAYACARYIAERTFILKACSVLPDDPEKLLRRLSPLDPEIVQAFIENFGLESGLGYLNIKHGSPSEIKFVYGFLEILRTAVKDEAVKHGYVA